jgi:hypothetical protein
MFDWSTLGASDGAATMPATDGDHQPSASTGPPQPPHYAPTSLQVLPTAAMFESIAAPVIRSSQSAMSFNSIAAARSSTCGSDDIENHSILPTASTTKHHAAQAAAHYARSNAAAGRDVFDLMLRKPFAAPALHSHQPLALPAAAAASAASALSSAIESRQPPPIDGLALHFPSPRLFSLVPAPTLPDSIPIANTFNSVERYRTTFLSALYEEVNGPLRELALEFAQAWSLITASKLPAPGAAASGRDASAATPLPCCSVHGGPPVRAVVKKEGPNCGKQFFSCVHRQSGCSWFAWDLSGEQQPLVSASSRVSNPLRSAAERQQYFRSKRIPFYAAAQLIVSRESGASASGQAGKSSWAAQRAAKRRKFQSGWGGDSDDDADGTDRADDNDGASGSDKSGRLFLKLADLEHSSVYAKDDLWIISSTEHFEATHVWFARSVYHAPAASGMLELAAIDRVHLPRNLKQQQNVWCIRGPNISSELSMMQNLRNLGEQGLPILPCLLHGAGAAVAAVSSRASNRPLVDCLKISPDTCAMHVRQICDEFGLNADQMSVISQCVRWLSPSYRPPASSHSSAPASPVVLCHGVFGSGKSSLLIALIILFNRLLVEAGDTQVRVLVASNTNVAVDRILLGLQDKGFDQFARVGSLKKIAKPLLKNVLHYSDKAISSADHDKLALKEYAEMLSKEMTPSDRRHIESAVAELKSQISAKRADKLKAMRVVGVTIAATAFEIMARNRFAVVLLDEASQMVEPASLLPLSRFGCERALLIGDPLQARDAIIAPKIAIMNSLFGSYISTKSTPF